MKFKDIIDGLKNGKLYTCKRWNNENVYIMLEEFINKVSGAVVIAKIFILVDENRNAMVQFTPSVENIFDDEWEEVE